MFRKYVAFYIHNNGDKEPVTVTNIDGKGNAWVTWNKDGFKNMVPLNRLKHIELDVKND